MGATPAEIRKMQLPLVPYRGITDALIGVSAVRLNLAFARGFPPLAADAAEPVGRAGDARGERAAVTRSLVSS